MTRVVRSIYAALLMLAMASSQVMAQAGGSGSGGAGGGAGGGTAGAGSSPSPTGTPGPTSAQPGTASQPPGTPQQQLPSTAAQPNVVAPGVTAGPTGLTVSPTRNRAARGGGSDFAPNDPSNDVSGDARLDPLGRNTRTLPGSQSGARVPSAPQTQSSTPAGAGGGRATGGTVGGGPVQRNAGDVESCYLRWDSQLNIPRDEWNAKCRRLIGETGN